MTRFAEVKVIVYDTEGHHRAGSVVLPEPLDRTDLIYQVGVLTRSVTATQPSETVRCRFCRKEWLFAPPWFAPKESAPRYCADHQKEGSRIIPCPTPDKRAFDSSAGAIRWALRSSGGTGKGMRPYRCPCGQFHITSKTARKPQPHNIQSTEGE